MLPKRIMLNKQNCRLIDMIAYLDEDQKEAVEERILDTFCTELEVDIKKLLIAYANKDVDRMVEAMTGWSLTSIMAKAKVVPDREHLFCSEPVPEGEVTFPDFWDETPVDEYTEKYCKCCGKKIVWEYPNLPDLYLASDSYMGGNFCDGCWETHQAVAPIHTV